MFVDNQADDKRITDLRGYTKSSCWYQGSCDGVMGNRQVAAVLKKYPGDGEGDLLFERMRSMKVEKIAPLAEEVFGDKLVYRINREVTQIKR